MSGFSFSHSERTASLKKLEPSSEPFDVCVVGGGITGAAIARDAALRGWKVLLVEKDDFASGTSSRSSKLVHGGVRYLEQYEFGLVAESTRERARLWKLAPQLVTPLGFLFPAFKTSRVPLWKLNIGLWLYDLLAAFRTPSLHKKYSRAQTMKIEPALKSDTLTGSVFYWDGMTDDALLTLANIIDAKQAGATPLSRVALESVEWNASVATDAQASHKIQLRDKIKGTSFSVRARIVVSATGPWTDELLKITGESPARPLLAPTRGSHIVVSAKKFPATYAVVMMHPQDGRVLFVIPWGETTVIGTTDIFDSASPDKVAIDANEVKYLLDAAKFYFPKNFLVPADVLSTWSGLRPLLAPPDEASASQVSREHHIEWVNPGMLVIAGGKLTTHREMAEQAIEKIYAATAHWNSVPGGAYRATETHEKPLPLFPERNTDPQAALGTSEGARLSLQDVVTICRTEMVLTIEDLLVRRTQIFYKEPRNGWDLLPKLRETLCRELDWDSMEWDKQVASYRTYLERNVLTPLRRELSLK